jgi:hypothetical protein
LLALPERLNRSGSRAMRKVVAAQTNESET